MRLLPFLLVLAGCSAPGQTAAIQECVRHGHPEGECIIAYRDMSEKKAKQNGRDASYLALDPTKSHRKRRR